MPSFRFLQNYSLNNLSSIWYCLIATCFQIFIIVRTIYRFTAYVALPWPNGKPPSNSVNSYMLFIGGSIIILPFFIVVAIMKVGNYSNDGRKLGIFNIRRYSKHLVGDVEEHQEDKEDCNNGCTDCGYLRAVWKHSLPIAPFLHFLISLCFLFPRLITESQLIRHGFLSKADIWKTDLDVLFGKLNGYRFTFFSQLRTINESEHRALFSESATLGQYFIRNSKSLSETFYELDESGHFSIEFANFVVALLILTSRYPSVFWRANKCFSLVFSLHLLFNLVQSIFTYAAFQVAFKIFVCDPTHLLIPYRDASSLSLTQLGSLLCVYLLLLHMSSLAVHVYGIQKYRDYRYARTKYMQDKYQSKPWFSYFSYFLAMAFFLLLSVLVGPLFYEFVIIYCGSLSIAPLLFILSTIAYYTFCILFWMCLAIKTKWSFEYDDFESDPFLAKKPANLEHSPLVIINGATVYRVKEDIAKQAIVNFVQTHLPSTQVAEENCSNLFLDRAQQNRVSFKSAQSEKPCGRFNKSANGRYSTRSYTKKSFDYQDASDSDCEYTTFQKTPKSQSFRLKQNFTTLPKATGTNEQHPVNMVTQSYTSVDDEPTYGFNFMFNSLLTSDEPSSPTLGNDKGSDTSSGIHSATSNSSTGISSSDKDKSNSLESLMETLAKLEAAVADKPNLRSLSQFRYNTIPTTVAVTYPQGPPNDVANRLY